MRTSLFKAGVYSILATFATALVLILVLGVSGCGKAEPAAGERDPARPNFRTKTVQIGNSMLPTFAFVEEIWVEHCSFHDLRAGDTVIYWHDRTKQYVHHRLSHRDAVTNRWVTKGDNNAGNDTGLMLASEFEGRTHKIITP